jgi:hypothetical protein
MGEETYNVICFYLRKKCRYGNDAPPEEQMECSQCPVYIMWRELFGQVAGEKTSENDLTNSDSDLD